MNKIGVSIAFYANLFIFIEYIDKRKTVFNLILVNVIIFSYGLSPLALKFVSLKQSILQIIKYGFHSEWDQFMANKDFSIDNIFGGGYCCDNQMFHFQQSVEYPESYPKQNYFLFCKQFKWG